jgi:hypothetical protein
MQDGLGYFSLSVVEAGFEPLLVGLGVERSTSGCCILSRDRGQCCKTLFVRDLRIVVIS